MKLGDVESDGEWLADINTTPLIDVMLVLLIMLIVTIPIQTHSVDLDMPIAVADAAPMPEVVRVEVAADGSVRWNGEPVAEGVPLEERFRAIATAPVPPEAHFRADGAAPYGRVAMVMAAAQRQGVKKAAIVGNERFGSEDGRGGER